MRDKPSSAALPRLHSLILCELLHPPPPPPSFLKIKCLPLVRGLAVEFTLMTSPRG